MTPLDFDPDDTASRVRVLPLPAVPVPNARFADLPPPAGGFLTFDRHGVRVCGVLGCLLPHFGYGRCNMHYRRSIRRAA